MLSSRIYQKWIRGSVKRGLRRQQSALEALTGDSASTGESALSVYQDASSTFDMSDVEEWFEPSYDDLPSEEEIAKVQALARRLAGVRIQITQLESLAGPVGGGEILRLKEHSNAICSELTAVLESWVNALGEDDILTHGKRSATFRSGTHDWLLLHDIYNSGNDVARSMRYQV